MFTFVKQADITDEQGVKPGLVSPAQFLSDRQLKNDCCAPLPIAKSPTKLNKYKKECDLREV